MWLLLACAPLRNPPIVEGGWLFFKGGLGEWDELCTVEDPPSCVPVGEEITVDTGRLPITRWNLDGELHLVMAPPTLDGLRVCARDPYVCQDVPVEGWEEGGGLPNGFATGDFDEDGQDDLVLVGEPGPPRLCLGGPLTGTRCETISAPSGNQYAFVGDVSADDHLDLLLTVGDEWEVPATLCLGDGTGNLDCADWDAGEVVAHGNTLNAVPGDVDGDGRTDVVLGRENALFDLVWCAAQDDPRTLCADGTTHPIPLPQNYGVDGYYGRMPADLALVDVDADADLDLVAVSADLLLYTCANDGAGTFTCTEWLDAIESYALAAEPLHVGDVDGDGDTDFAVVTTRAELGPWLCRNDAGSFSCAERRGTQSARPAGLEILPASWR